MRNRSRPCTVVLFAEGPRDRAGAESLLAARGYRVRAADDAAEAIECVRYGGADVVVLGLVESFQVLDLIRRLRGRFEPIPLPVPPRIIVAAGNMDAPSERFTRSLGADAVLRKPLQGNELAEIVGRLSRQAARTSLGPATATQAS